jgi:hypothetical protein
MNLRRKAAETLESVSHASTSVQDAAAVQTITIGFLCLGVIVAIALGVKALNR